MKPTRLYLVRHGETLWNAEQRMQGQLNSDLTEKGKKQARLLGEKLANQPIDVCYTSDSQRAVETASLVTQHLALTPQVDSSLREIGMGTWEGRTRSDIQQVEPIEWHHFWESPQLFQGNNGGETFRMLEKRVTNSLEKIATTHSGENVLLISHRLTIKMMVNALSQQPVAALHQLADIKPNSLSIIQLSQSLVEINTYSDTSHYE